MKYSSPKLDVYRDRVTGDFLIQDYMEHPEYGYSLTTGEFVPVDQETMRTQGLDIVLEHLSKYPERTEQTDSGAGSMSIEASRRFQEEHPNVLIVLENPSTLSISRMALDAEGDGARGVKKEKVTLPTTAACFFRVLCSLLE